MTDNDIKKIIRERAYPKLYDFAYIATRAHRAAFTQFISLLSAGQKKNKAPYAVLDAGCGYKPFCEALVSTVEVGEYIGVDFDRNRSYADIEAPLESLPFGNDCFDAIIASEVLEHVRDLAASLAELRRVAKDGAFIYISTPFMFPEHGIPYDFRRITRYAYYDLFAGDEILALVPTNTSWATPWYLFNVAWKSMTVLERIPILTHIFYALNNIAGIIAEWKVAIAGFLGRIAFRHRRAWFDACFEHYFYRMPAGYDVIVKIRKK